MARQWIAAWDSHELEAILEQYDDAVELTSLVAAQILGTDDGRVVSKADLRDYFQRGLQVHPDLVFRLEDVL